MNFRTRETVGQKRVNVLGATRNYHDNRYAPHDSYAVGLPQTYTLSYERITDVAGPKHAFASHGSLADKPVHHVKWQFEDYRNELPGYQCFNHTSWGHEDVLFNAPSFWRLNQVLGVISGIYDYNRDMGFWMYEQMAGSVPSTGIRSHDERWQDTRPTLSSRTNMAVFLYELRDTKQLFSVLPKRHFGVPTWRNLLMYANSQHLNYNFGWKPFVKDLSKIFRTLQDFEHRLQVFKENQNRDLRHHARDPLSESMVTLTYSSPSIDWIAKAEINYSGYGCSTFNYRYSIPEYGAGELKLRAYLDSLGLHPSVGNLWAILPYSFVVDWFVDLGGYLDSFQEDWLQPWVDFSGSVQSLKWEATGTWSLRCTACSANAYQAFARMRAKSYVRSTGVHGWTFSDRDLSADRIRLLSSLAISKLK